MPPPSKTSIDQLGERLKRSEITEDDLRLLDAFRRSFAPAYEHVIAVIRSNVISEPTGRPAKSTSSIIEKLQRETVRLTQMQDIAGCRLVVPGVRAQAKVVAALQGSLGEVVVTDRRKRPSHGYRAVHIVATSHSKPIEIQVRTTLQHLWAEFSEKLADVVDPLIKYGGGTEKVRKLLEDYSDLVARVEAIELGAGIKSTPELRALKGRLRRLLKKEVARIEKG